MALNYHVVPFPRLFLLLFWKRTSVSMSSFEAFTFKIVKEYKCRNCVFLKNHPKKQNEKTLDQWRLKNVVLLNQLHSASTCLTAYLYLVQGVVALAVRSLVTVLLLKNSAGRRKMGTKLELVGSFWCWLWLQLLLVFLSSTTSVSVGTSYHCLEPPCTAVSLWRTCYVDAEDINSLLGQSCIELRKY